MNFKEQKLGAMLFNRLKVHFPEIELADITESMESSDQIWVKIAMPSDEDRAIALQELAAEISTDILMDHGHHITIFPAPNMAENLVQA
jgi:RNA-binding protein YhbY